MASESDSPQASPWGFVAKAFVILVCLIFTMSFIASVWSTHNPLFILGGLGTAFYGLLQVKFIHDWFTESFIRFLNIFETYLVHGIKWCKKVVSKQKSMITILVLIGIIFAFAVKDYTPLPGMLENPRGTISMDGISVIPMQVSEIKDQPSIKTYMNLGIIDTKNAGGPFNQYDADNNDTERDLENKIFTQNQDCHGRSSVTLIVATALSQTVADTGLSSKAGLDDLRGAYLSQYNFNHDSSQHVCLHLLIANFGTKGVVSQTIPPLMQQIHSYAESDPQHFMGIVGFPFSVSVRQALYARSRIPGDDIPIVVPTAAADSFADPNSTAPLPAHFSTDVYRVSNPVSVESQVLEDFMTNHSQNALAPAQSQTVLFEDPGDPYSKSLGDALYQNVNGVIEPEYYTIGQPSTLNPGIDYIIRNQCQPNQQPSCKPIQIFFAGYADDLNIVKNKLNAAREQGYLTQFPLHIIGGEGFYDLGSYNIGNYANLFFTTNASYGRINPWFASNEIPSAYRHCPGHPPESQPFNCEFSSFFHQVYPTNIYGSELASMHVLLTYDAVQSFLHALGQVKETTTPLWQAMNAHWSDVKFEGVSGKIQFPLSKNDDSVNNPMNKPVYVACTDNKGSTHVVAEYDMQHDNQLPAQPDIDNNELHACLKGS